VGDSSAKIFFIKIEIILMLVSYFFGGLIVGLISRISGFSSGSRCGVSCIFSRSLQFLYALSAFMVFRQGER